MSHHDDTTSHQPIDAEHTAGRGILAWFSTREWIVLGAALALVVGVTGAAALSTEHSADAATAARCPLHSAAASSAVAPAATTTATITATAVSTTATRVATPSTTSVAATVVASTTRTTTTSSVNTATTKKTTAKKKTAKSTATVAVPTPLVSVGAYVTYGNYAGSPLRWRVLDADSTGVTLLSQYVVSAGAFQSDWEGRNASLYSASEVRAWLKGTFAEAAFNSTETAALLSHIGGPATGDRVFLLSAAEVQHYFPKAADRKAAPGIGAGSGQVGFSGEGLTLSGPYSAWWLADSASDDFSAQVVKADGKLGSQLVYYADLGVRPAIRLDRTKIGFTLSAGGN